MRFMVTVRMPTDVSNALPKTPANIERMQEILTSQKAENPHFGALDGQRGCVYFVDISDASKLPSIAEPWWLLTQANVTVTPMMNAQEFAKAGADIVTAAKRYGT